MAVKEEKHILITGFGGQGVVMAGDILGKAATLYDHKIATLTRAYGPEARGSSSSAQVIISEEEIFFPYIREPRILVCLSQDGYAKNAGKLSRGCVLVWDTDLVQTKNLDPGVITYNIPATRFAEEMGNKMMANIVMLGFLTAVCTLVSVEAMREAIRTSFPEPTGEANERAFERGREYGEAILKSRTKQKRVRD